MPRLERPPRFLLDGTMPKFWPPRPNRFWRAMMAPLRFYFERFTWRLTGIDAQGADQAFARIKPGDGVLITPNHCDDADGYVVVQSARRPEREMYFMAAWQGFLRYRGLAAWALQRMGGFSVDREGADRRAVRQAIEILSAGQSLLVFPEGEVYHLSGRLRPLLEGVAFMALTAQRAMQEQRVWILPTAVSYRYADDVMPELERTMARLERRMLALRPNPDATLAERIVRYGELLVTIKEKEKLGHSRENEGDLSSRIIALTDAVLRQREEQFLDGPSDKPVPQRVRMLRRPLLETWGDEDADPAARRVAREALDDVQLAMQLFSYPGDYVTENPTVERMAETIDKFEEDIYWSVRPKGRRRARVVFGEPIDIRPHVESSRLREAAAVVTDQLTESIQGLLSRP